MKLDTLYPYWEMAHDEVLETVGFLTADQIEETPHAGQSLNQILVAFASHERYEIGHLVGGHRYDRPLTAEHRSAEALLELLTVTREITERVAATLNAASLRSVRTLPASVEMNRPETNVTVAWLFWDVMQQEIRTLGRVSQRFDDQGWRRNRRRR